ncbi:MAG: TonB-dependent receptor [Sphingobium sp.]
MAAYRGEALSSINNLHDQRYLGIQFSGKGEPIMSRNRNKNMRIRTSSSFVAVGLIISGLASNTALAQSGARSASEGAMSDIIVTAQRREQSIQDVGVSITAIGAESLRQFAMQDSTEIVRQTPNIVFAGGTNSAFLTIRGVSQTDFGTHQEAPNAVYLDDVYVASPAAVTFGLYDMQRVEALRGPQGTLFGRNSTGGLVHYITARPTEELSGFVDAQYGSFNRLRVEGAAGGSLTQGLRIRLAGLIDTDEGSFKNLLPGYKDGNNRHFRGGRGQIAADLGPDFEALVSVTYNEEKSRGGKYHHRSAYNDPTTGDHLFLPRDVDYYGTGPGADMFGYLGPKDGNKGEFTDEAGIDKRFVSATFQLSGKIGEASLVSITNYNSFKSRYREDCDGRPDQVCRYITGAKPRQWSQEIRLNGDAGNLNWTVGAYYLSIKADYSSYFDLPYFSGTPYYFAIINDYAQKTKNYAAFAQGEYAFSDAFKLIVGGRLNHEKKEFSTIVDDLTTGSPVEIDRFDTATVGSLAKIKKTDWAGKVELDYKPNRDTLVYASVSRGIRGGGFNAVSTTPIAHENIPFGNETIVAYELGTKIGFMGGRSYLNLGGFYYDYSDFQAFDFRGLAGFVSNYDARMYGAEAELSVEPFDKFLIKLGGSYNNAKVKGLFVRGETRDVPPTMAPKWTANGLIRKEWAVGSGSFAALWDFNYLSSRYSSLSMQNVLRLKSSFVHNARISYSGNDGQWELYGFVKNISNVDRRSFAYDLTSDFGMVAEVYDRPREFGVGARFTF